MENVLIKELSLENLDIYLKFLNEIGWKSTRQDVLKAFKVYRETGYSTVYVASYGGNVIGRVLLDTVYPPYAEIVNLYVHPDYRNKGIGSKLVKECIKRAEEKGHYIIYLMCDPTDLKIHKFYERLGFTLVIFDRKRRNDIWLYFFGSKSFVREFINLHSFVEKRALKYKPIFYGEKLYAIYYTDPLTRETLKVFFKGQPGQPIKSGIMPRIVAVAYNTRDLNIVAWVEENDKRISLVEPAEFTLYIRNLGNSIVKVLPKPLTSPELSIEGSFNKIYLNPGEKLNMLYKLNIERKEFIKLVEFLSFPTIIASIELQVNKRKLVVSAGFNFEI